MPCALFQDSGFINSSFDDMPNGLPRCWHFCELNVVQISVTNCYACLTEHKTVVDQSRLKVYDNDADSEIVRQSHHLKDCIENH